MSAPASPRPLKESERQAALEAYRILDSDPEQAYDDIVEVAARLCDTPTAFISFIDGDRQWFKARVGLELAETARDDAICAHTVVEGEPLVVPDLRRDARFRDNPFVQEEGGPVFYAGAPLETPEGHGIGTLCVVDRRPRQLDADAVASLEALARLVMQELELRRTADRLARVLDRTRLLGEALPLCRGCGRVRNDDAYWEQLETFLAHEVGSLVTHGICPACAREQYPELGGDDD